MMFNLFKKNKKHNNIEIKSPFKGKCFDIKEIPDEVFASKMMGDGTGFDSSDGILYSPVDGEIVQIFPTKHAVMIKSNDGLEILLHIGIDTVQMQGEGFEAFVKADDKVKTGDKLVTFNKELVKEKAKSDLSPMVITNMDVVENIDFNYGDVDKDSTVITLKIDRKSTRLNSSHANISYAVF